MSNQKTIELKKTSLMIGEVENVGARNDLNGNQLMDNASRQREGEGHLELIRCRSLMN